MNLTLIRPDRIFAYSLPDEVTGKHWLCDVGPLGKARKFAAVDAHDSQWQISPFGKSGIFAEDGHEEKRLTLDTGTALIPLMLPEGIPGKLLVEDPREHDKSFTKLGFTGDMVISVGSASDNMICYNSPFVSPQHALLFLEDERFWVIDTESDNGVFVNMRAIPKNVKVSLGFGDVVYIMGLKIVIGRRFIGVNNPGGAAYITSHPLQVPYVPQELHPVEDQVSEEDQQDFFYRSPRIKRDIEKMELEVEAPPNQEKAEQSPAILKIGPSVGMALGSTMMGLYMVSNILSGQGDPMRALPMGSMMVVMILGAILWPNLSRRYEKRKSADQESKRKAAYAGYLDKIRTNLLQTVSLQQEILEENRISVAECLSRTANQDRRLFERTVLHSDFLELRVGRGDLPLDAEIKFPADKLTIEEDLLKSLVNDLAKQPLELLNVPLSLSLVDDYVCGVVGQKDDYYPFMRGIIAQICALHATDEVKVVFFGDGEDEQEWSFIRCLPHIFDGSQSARFLITDHGETAEISLRLEREMQQRNEAKAEHPGDYGIYYVVIVANRELASSADVLAKLTALRTNKGFTVMTFADKLSELPKECTRIIELKGVSGTLYDPRDASGEQSTFVSDIALTPEQAEGFSESLAAIRIDLEEAHNALPKSLGFLEMFEAGMVEHLNIKSRWEESNPTLSLATPLGLDVMGEPSLLDIHEDFHGPHGLVAGMTGSGKSETIITYILSLAVNYRPDEVSFVLIDYKGGGLAGAFDNDAARLPHLAGTITNLDGAAIQRSLVSINSELRRRQDVFNQARDIAGESTMDIYKYQALYREGKVGEPIPHLVIVSDEFAELKSQQPEFMDELISAARIGRSLGVHLILATQKPSGVVNDQIWSNAKFKICLKVAEAADSKEMLKRPDAAELVDAGRYYLQVGYNEYFAMGQSAYAGASYIPKEEYEPHKDNSVVLINNNGRPLMAAKPEVSRQTGGKTPEARAVLIHIASVAEQMGLKAPTLWVDPIPAHITLDEVSKRYAHKVVPYVLDPVVGEYDDPANQRQDLLTLPLSESGNTVLYGSTGTGVESLLNTLLYSLISSHDAQELSIYIMDFGAETLGVFRRAPQVGDVLFSGDEDKVNRLFEMLAKTIERRKKILSTSGKSFDAYNADALGAAAGAGGAGAAAAGAAAGAAGGKAHDAMPNIVVVLNGILAFYDIFPKLEETIIRLTRDANRYGIYFIFTANQASAVRLRLRTNFKQNLVLQFNDPNDYIAIFGTMRGIPIPTGYGRGLAANDGTFEFQTAFVNNADTLESQAIEQGIEQIIKTSTQNAHLVKAPMIPVLPSRVSYQHLLSSSIDEKAIPFGLLERSIEPAYLDFEDSPFVRCLFNRIKDGSAFMQAFISMLAEHQSYYEPIVMDLAHLLPNNADLGCRVLVSDEDAMAVFDDLIAKEDLQEKQTAALGVPPKELVAGTGQDAALDKPHLILISGIAGFLLRIDPTRAMVIKGFLKNLKEGQGILFFLYDSTSDATYASEEWFKAQIGNKSGLWIGEGLGSQSAYNINFGMGQTIDPLVKGDRGYLIVDGLYSTVKYLMPDKVV